MITMIIEVTTSTCPSVKNYPFCLSLAVRCRFCSRCSRCLNDPTALKIPCHDRLMKRLKPMTYEAKAVDESNSSPSLASLRGLSLLPLPTSTLMLSDGALNLRGWNRLPTTLVALMMQCNDLETLLVAQTICKDWHRVGRRRDAWCVFRYHDTTSRLVTLLDRSVATRMGIQYASTVEVIPSDMIQETFNYGQDSRLIEVNKSLSVRTSSQQTDAVSGVCALLLDNRNLTALRMAMGPRNTLKQQALDEYFDLVGEQLRKLTICFQDEGSIGKGYNDVVLPKSLQLTKLCDLCLEHMSVICPIVSPGFQWTPPPHLTSLRLLDVQFGTVLGGHYRYLNLDLRVVGPHLRVLHLFDLDAVTILSPTIFHDLEEFSYRSDATTAAEKIFKILSHLTSHEVDFKSERSSVSIPDTDTTDEIDTMTTTTSMVVARRVRKGLRVLKLECRLPYNENMVFTKIPCIASLEELRLFSGWRRGTAVILNSRHIHSFMGPRLFRIELRFTGGPEYDRTYKVLMESAPSLRELLVDLGERQTPQDELGIREIKESEPNDRSMFRIQSSQVAYGGSVVSDDFTLNGKANACAIIILERPLPASFDDDFSPSLLGGGTYSWYLTALGTANNYLSALLRRGVVMAATCTSHKTIAKDVRRRVTYLATSFCSTVPIDTAVVSV